MALLLQMNVQGGLYYVFIHNDVGGQLGLFVISRNTIQDIYLFYVMYLILTTELLKSLSFKLIQYTCMYNYNTLVHRL